MRKIFSIVMFGLVCLFISAPVRAEGEVINYLRGGFFIEGYLSVGMGWQHFNDKNITARAADGSYAGVLGSILPQLPSVSQGKNYSTAFIEVFELDIIKNIGERTLLRGDVLFGRKNSGSWVANDITIEQAYAAIELNENNDMELIVGRFGSQAMVEPYEPYNMDSISWSILSRSLIIPIMLTGAQLSFEVNDNLLLYFAVVNGLTNDTTAKINNVPSGLMSIYLLWGDEPRVNNFIITPFVGPETGVSNGHLSFGSDFTLNWWATDKFKLGAEAVIRRDDGRGGPNNLYVGSLLNLRYDITEKLYGYVKYAYMNQFEDSNGVLNLTGAKQQTHEFSVGGGYSIAEGIKFKFEGRLDAIIPRHDSKQWVPGVAIGMNCAM